MFPIFIPSDKEENHVPEVKKCAVCGKILKGQQVRYCSVNCKNKASYLKARNEKVEVQQPQVCPYCGKVFYNNKRIYCSTDCSRKANTERQAETYRKMKPPEKPKKKSLSWDEIIKGMQETGLQYGEYVARYEK